MSKPLSNGIQSHNTVNVTQELHSSALTNTGGTEPALSSATRLGDAFSGSPIHHTAGAFNAEEGSTDTWLTMANVKKQHVRVVAPWHYGHIVAGDRASIQAYYGFDDTTPGNMKYGGSEAGGDDPGSDKAPCIIPDGVYTPQKDGESVLVVPQLASPYMPNLTPPDIETLQPQRDAEGNPLVTVYHADKVDFPPPDGTTGGMLENNIPGSGPRSFLLDPAKTSQTNQSWVLEVDTEEETSMGPKFGGGGPSGPSAP